MSEAQIVKALLGMVLALVWYIWRKNEKSMNGVGAKVSKVIAYLQESAKTEEERKRITDLFFK